MDGPVLPPELLGSYIASGANHVTGRRRELSFRAASALFGSFGIEWDLAEAEAEELEHLTAWVAHCKQFRQLIPTDSNPSGPPQNPRSDDIFLDLPGVILSLLICVSDPQVAPAGSPGGHSVGSYVRFCTSCPCSWCVIPWE